MVYTLLSGKKFNELYKNNTFCKMLNDDLKHFKYKYKHGENIDINNFYSYDACSEGGLYFCDVNELYRYILSYGSLFSYVKIPNDAEVYIEKNKFKSNKIILQKIQHICELRELKDSNYVLNLIKKNPMSLKYIDEQTKEICDLAISLDPFSIQFIKNQTKELCELAISKDLRTIAHIKNKTREIYEFAANCVESKKHSLCAVYIYYDEIY